MQTTRKFRAAAVLAAVAISTVGLGVAGTATAGAAAPRDVAGHQKRTHLTSAAVTTGTYHVFIDSGGGFVDGGALYLNTDTSWTMSNYTDGGSWAVVGKTLGLSDFNGAGLPHGAAWAVKVSGTKLGTVKKPGFANAGAFSSLSFYATFVSSSVAQPASSRRHAFVAGGVRNAGATFPGTYDTSTPGGEVQTAYNADNTWSMTSGCNSGSYVSFNKTIVMGDQGCVVDHLWMAAEKGATKLGTAKKPGIISEAPVGVFNSWYALLAS
jgi:hypothetical protein